MENVKELAVHHLANVVRAKTDQVLIVDSRTFCEFNTSHVIGSVNVWSSKIRKKRLQQSSMSVQDYLSSACEVRRCADFGRQWSQIIVYDQSAPGLTAVPNDSFLYVLLDKLSSFYKNVHLLVGGFLEFQSQYPDCCEDASQKCSPLTSLSQPCLPVANVGPTRILPFLYLGSQHDANNRQMLQDYSVLYELNVSASCPKPDFVQDSHFLRIPVNDNFSEKLTPYFFDAFHFIDKVRESGGSVLVHCLAGISRSATVAIAYVMKHLHLPYEEAYRYVKNRRPTISPNINFVGQLLELDKLLRSVGVLCDPSSAPPSFRQPGALPSTPYGATITSITSCSSNTSFSLDYAVNNKTTSSAGVLSDASSASCYSLSSLASSTSFRNSENTTAGKSSSFDGTHNTSNSNSFGDSVTRSGCYISSSPLASQQSNIGGNVSLTHITQDAPLPFATSYSSSMSQTSSVNSVSPPCHATRALSLGLYSKSSNISTQFGKGISSSTRGEDHRICLKRGAVSTASSYGGASTGLGIPRSLSLNLKSTLEAVPGSPGSTPQSPESAATISKLNFGLLSPPSMVESGTRTPDSPYMSCDSVPHSPNSQGSPMSSSHSPTTALSKLSFTNNNSGVTGEDSRHYSLMSSRSSSLKSLMSTSNFSQGSKSPTIIEVRKSPTITENVFEAQYSALQSGIVSSNDQEYRASNEESLKNNINRNYYSSTATISVSASDSQNIHKNNNNNGNNSSGNEMTGGNDNRPRSVCIIEVNTETPVTYVENCSSEPMIVRETEVIATPCTQADLRQRLNSSPPAPVPVDNNSNVQYAALDDDNINSISTCSANAIDTIDGSATRREKPQHKTLVPIRASASFGSILDRPKVLELCAPIYNAERPVFLGNGAGAFVMGDCTWQTRNPEELDESASVCTGVVKPVPFRPPTAGLSAFPSSTSSVSSIAPTNLITTSTNSTQTSPTPFRNLEKSNTLGVIHDSENTSVADSSDFNDTASEFSVMQSDSGISFQTDSDSNLHHPIPRCYSSSETHLNTRRLLENNACADYSTRKSCSNDEVAKNWSLHKPLTNMNSHPLPITRDSANSNTNNNFGPMSHSNWNYLGELVRCDSWSTSGLGSELSDWESLQEDANSSNCDDAMGPFDAVFSDVFPGDRSDSLNSPQIYHHVFPQLFRESTGSDEKGNCASVGNSSSLDQKPRHHSFKEPQQRLRQLQQHKQIPLARPASLPGVMGSYLAQIQPNTEPGLDAEAADENGQVELRPTNNRGGPVVGGLKRASAGSRDSGYSSSSIGTNSSSGGGGVRRNDCGYYSVPEPLSFSASRPAGFSREPSQEESNSNEAQSSVTGRPLAVVGSRKPLLKQQPLPTQRPVPFKAPGSRSPASPPPKSPSPPKAQTRRQTSSSPQKSPSPPKSSLPISRLKSASPPKPSASYQDSSCSPQRSPSPCKPMSPHRSGTSRTSGSPQPRIFGASTFYLPQTSESSLLSSKSGPAKKSSASESSTPSSSTSQKKPSTSNSKSLSSNLCSKSTTTKASNNGGGCKRATIGSSSKTAKSGSNPSITKNTPFSSRPECLSARHNSKSPSPAFSTSRSPSLECSSSTQNSETSSSIETAYMNKSSSSSSREPSVESDSSIVNKLVSLSTSTNAAGTSACSSGEYSSSATSMQAFRTKGTSNSTSSGNGKNSPNFGRRSSSPNCDTCDAEDSTCVDFSATSAGERRSPEKRKNRSGSEDSKGKEKRRSCDLDLGAFDEQLKKPISLKSGVRLAQELLQSMENIVSSELSEIRRCTAELSSRYRLKPRQRESETIAAGGTGGNVSYGAGNGSRKIKAPSSQFYLLPDRPTTPSTAYPSSVPAVCVGVSGGCTSVSAAAAAADSVTSSRPHHRLHHHHHHHSHHHHHRKYTTSSKDSWGAASFASSKEIALSGALTPSSGAGVEDGGERSRSEPPFSGDEGLYRAQSCPGLPLPQQQHLHHQHLYHHQQQPTHLLHQERSDEGHETVAELRRPGEGGVLLRLRTERTPPAREKLLNRYSCGTLDTQKQPLTPPRMDAAFESCPDLATLRGGRACTSDSSSSSVSSSRSSFSRLLPVS